MAQRHAVCGFPPLSLCVSLSVSVWSVCVPRTRWVGLQLADWRLCACSQSGDTALIVAAFNGHEAVLRKLIAAGADPTAKAKVREGLLVCMDWCGVRRLPRTAAAAAATLSTRRMARTLWTTPRSTAAAGV